MSAVEKADLGLNINTVLAACGQSLTRIMHLHKSQETCRKRKLQFMFLIMLYEQNVSEII